jgi:acyl-CoA dehydrogenase
VLKIRSSSTCLFDEPGLRTSALSLSPEAASALKLHTTEVFGRVADACLQLFGGYGYMAEYPISRFWTDARVLRIYGGTSEIMKELVARSLLGR